MKPNRRVLCSLALIAAWVLCSPALASALASPLSIEPGVAAVPPALEGVSIEQRLGASIPVDLRFRDEHGNSVRLGDALGGKTTVLNLVYYECPMLCTLVLNGLLSSMRALAFDVGEEFRVVTLSIDPSETAELAAAKKRNALAEYGRPGAAQGWPFLTGDEAAIRELTEAVGFGYRYDPKTDVYAHAAGIIVITPDGTVSRYLLGVDYPPRDLKLALVEAGEGRIGSLADQLLLFCYPYDPESGRYSLTILTLVRAGGIVTVVLLVTFVLLARRREARRARPQTV